MGLLFEEPNGLAADFTDTADFVRQTWQQQSVRQRANVGINLRSSPHEFFTQSGTSPKYVKGATYSLEWSPHNYITSSEQLDTGWSTDHATIVRNHTRAPDGKLTAAMLYASTDGSPEQHFAVVSYADISSGASYYTVSAYVKAGTATWFAFSNSGFFCYFNIGSGVVGTAGSGTNSIEDVGDGWYRCVWTNPPDGQGAALRLRIVNADNDPDYTGAGEYLHVWGVQANKGNVAASYIATTSAAVIGLPISYGEGLLTEPAATNLLLRSEDFSTEWSGFGEGVVTTNTTVAPNGTTTADTLEAEAPISEIIQFPTVVGNETITFSCYLKAGTGSWACLTIFDFNDDSVRCWFNLSAGTIGTPTTVGAWTHVAAPTMTDVGGGWYRCTVTTTINSATCCNEIIISNADNTFSTTAGQTIRMWGAQTEVGTVATSYIPTAGSTVTRAIDGVNWPLAAIPFSTSAGTIGVLFNPRSAVLDADYYVHLIGTPDNGSPTVAAVSDNFISAIFGDAGSVIDPGDPTVDADNISKFAFASGDAAHRLNSSTSTSADTFTIVNNVTGSLGVNGDDMSVSLNGLLKKFVYVPRRVTDGDLPTWSFTE